MSECLFCRIVKGEIPAQKVYEDDDILAFDDITPQAPVHVLIIPKKHIPTVNDITEEDEGLIGKIFSVSKKIAKEKGVAERGYRIVVNSNQDAGQMVYHLHYHLMGGRPMGWPPG